MKASVIVPNHGHDRELPAMLASIERAAAAFPGEVETLVSPDPEGRGLSWARNRGLERAKGDYVFFADADDTVCEGFFALPVARLEATGADICVFECSAFGIRGDFECEGQAAIREAFMPAFLGRGWGDVLRFRSRRECAGVWRFAFRRSLIESAGGIRFNEALGIYEDAPFICECALHARKTTMIREKLYNYTPGPNGIINTVTGTRVHWDYKREILRERRRLDAAAGGALRGYYAASQLLGRLEMLRYFFGKRREGK